MKNLVKVLCVSILLIFIFFLCKKKDKKERPIIKKEIQIDSNAVLTLINPSMKKDSFGVIVKLLGLSDIKSKSTPIEIRVWLEYSSSDSGKIILFKKRENIWHSDAYFYKYNYDNGFNIISIDKKIESKEPISGWQSFLEQLEALNIYKLRNYNEIPKYTSCMDPDQLMIEVWKNNQYNIYEYPCFEANSEEMGNEDVKEIMKIGFLIKDEFGYNFFSRP